MATRIWETQVTVPPNTLQSAPQITAWVTEDNLVEAIELQIPPGHNGKTGIRVMKGDVPILPYNSSAYIIANAYSNEFPVNDYVPTGDLKIHTFNIGSYPHTFYLRMTVSDFDRSGAVSASLASQAIPAGEIQAPTDPLSPDAILGVSVTDQLASGQITADDLQPVDTSGLEVPPEPQPTGF